MLQERRHSAIAPTGERLIPVPEQSMVDQEQWSRPIWLQYRHHSVDRRLGRIDCGNYSADLSSVLDLQSIDRVRLVRNVLDLEIFVEVPADISKAGGDRHVRSAVS
jgi:hypothetical protein